MSFYFTSVPTATHHPKSISPTTTYQISNDIILKPATRTYYKDPFGSGSALMGRLFFISNSNNVEEHIQKLRKWIIFHAFILWFPFLCDLFERGLLTEHHQANSIDEISDTNTSETNEMLTDFENFTPQIYFFSPPSITRSYKSLYKTYEELSAKNIALLETCLFQIKPLPVSYSSYILFDPRRHYWQIAIYCTVLEEILGHAPDCPGSVTSCSMCKRQNLAPHRSKSEKDWRNAVLSEFIKDEKVKKQYLRIINAAFYEIRHKTAHLGQLPVPAMVFPETEREIYDIERAIKDFGSDDLALQSLHSHVSLLSRYLLLHKVFQFDIFPEIPPFQTIGTGL